MKPSKKYLVVVGLNLGSDVAGGRVVFESEYFETRKVAEDFARRMLAEWRNTKPEVQVTINESVDSE